MALAEDNKYPSHLDVAWIAVDRKGQIGVFTTGGVGPIPKVYLSDGTALDRLGLAVTALSVTCDYCLFAKVPRSDDFIWFAQRGLFAFDWTDAHRTKREVIDRYELQASPNVPANIQTVRWAPPLVDFLKSVTSETLDYNENRIDVIASFECAAQPGISGALNPTKRGDYFEPRHGSVICATIGSSALVRFAG